MISSTMAFTLSTVHDFPAAVYILYSVLTLGVWSFEAISSGLAASKSDIYRYVVYIEVGAVFYFVFGLIHFIFISDSNLTTKKRSQVFSDAKLDCFFYLLATVYSIYCIRHKHGQKQEIEIKPLTI